jgi:hypothetical protein
MVGRRIVIAMSLALTLGGGSWACGGGGNDRDTKVCRSCATGINQGCLDACRDFCVAGDPDCDARCRAQCDECRRDLVCSACRANCTGTESRCAPQNETVECKDGTFGGAAS